MGHAEMAAVMVYRFILSKSVSYFVKQEGLGSSYHC